MRKQTRYIVSLAIALIITLVLVAGMPLLLKFAAPPRQDQHRDAISLAGAMKIKPPPPRKKVERKKPPPRPKVNPQIKNIMPKFDSSNLLDVPFQFDLGLSQGDGGPGLDLGLKIWSEGDVDVKPVPLFRARPSYPAAAMRKNLKGRVAFKLLVDANGMVKTVEITEAEPQGVFEEAAVQAVQQWRFQPAKVKGEPVSCWCQSSITFELDLN